MALAVSSICSVKATLTGAATTFGTPTFVDPTIPAARDFTDGTGNFQAQKLYVSAARTLSASANETLDLAGGLTDPLGATLTFTVIKGIYIEAASGNTNDVVIGNATSNGFTGPFGATTHTIAVKPGGKLFLEAPNTGWTVTAGTGDILKVLNGGSGTSVSYDIKIWGY